VSAVLPAAEPVLWLCACGHEGGADTLRPSPSGALVCPRCGASGDLASDGGDPSRRARLRAGQQRLQARRALLAGPAISVDVLQPADVQSVITGFGVEVFIRDRRINVQRDPSENEGGVGQAFDELTRLGFELGPVTARADGKVLPPGKLAPGAKLGFEVLGRPVPRGGQ
jgi:hypothetical protein